MCGRRSAIIIGGGIIGVTSAYALARNGWRVTILDANGGPAMGASWGNARQLSYSHTNALGHPRLLAKIPAIALGRADGLSLDPSADPALVMWMVKLLGNCTKAAFKRNTLAALKLAERSRRAMDALLSAHEIAFERRKPGKLTLLSNPRERADAANYVQMKRDAGARLDLLSGDDAAMIEPALSGYAQTPIAAIYAPDDETGDCHKFAAGLLDILETRYGVRFGGGMRAVALGRSGAEWTVRTGDGAEFCADLVVLASGAQANGLLKPIGLAQPIQPMKGYSFTAPLGARPPTASITDQARRIVFTNLGDRMLIAGVAELGNHSPEVDSAVLDKLIGTAQAAMPDAALYNESDEGWAGLRPATPDSLPIIRALAPGLVANIGHGMLGWTLAMGSAETLADLAGHAASAHSGSASCCGQSQVSSAPRAINAAGVTNSASAAALRALPRRADKAFSPARTATRCQAHPGGNTRQTLL